MLERDREWGVVSSMDGERGVIVRGRWRSKGLRERKSEEGSWGRERDKHQKGLEFGEE